MSLPPVYLHALGMVNALGGGVDSIVPRSQPRNRPAWG